MNSSKRSNCIPCKMILSAVLFLVFVGIISCVIYFPYRRPYTTDHDYSMVFAGASIFTRGINPNLVDEKTGESSYVLATKGAPLSGRYRLLDAALDNEHLDTVVLEVSYHTLIKPTEDYTLDSRLLYFPKVMGVGNKLQTAVTDFSFWEDDYDQLYAQTLYEGIQIWIKYILRSKYKTYLSYRGFQPYEAENQRIASAEEAKQSEKSVTLDVDFPQDVVEDLEKLLQLCQERNLRVIMVTMPLSQAFIWQNTGLDTYRQVMNEIADRYQLAYFDFNLLENIGSYLDDASSYHDYEHLSEAGAAAFSPVIGDVLNACLRGEEIPYRFYDSYEEAREHSIYQSAF